MENKDIKEIGCELQDENDGLAEDSENNDVQLKSNWQLAKEQQYAKLNVTEKQLNLIIAVAGAALVTVFVMIALDALGIF